MLCTHIVRWHHLDDRVSRLAECYQLNVGENVVIAPLHCFACGDETPCLCGRLKELAAERPETIGYSTELNEYALFGNGQGVVILRYCPNCGRRLPTSCRRNFFSVPTAVDRERARAIVAAIDSKEKMILLLGHPTEEHVHHDVIRCVYRHFSETADLELRFTGSQVVGEAISQLRLPFVEWCSV